MRPYVEALRATRHEGIPCYDCHLQSGAWDWPAFKLSELFDMYPHASETTLTGPTSRISPAPCLKCHENVFTARVRKNGLRIEHRFCAPRDTCDGCHTAAVHGDAIRWTRQSIMEECVVCHSEQKVPTECDTCHDGRIESERLQKGPWQITHGSNWETTHGMGDLRYCATCHPEDYCTPCHKTRLPHGLDFPARHGAEALARNNTCLKCHDAKSLCDPCHGLAMPHPTGFLGSHSSIAATRDDASCLACHRVSDCERCHNTHTHPGSTDGNLGDSLPRPEGDAR